MANATKSDTAIGMANNLISLAAQLKALYDAATAFNGRNASFSPDTYWRQMATAAVSADGSLGAADTPLNLAHPITVGGLNRAEADLLPGVTLMIEFGQFIGGTLPTNRAQVNRLGTLDTLIG